MTIKEQIEVSDGILASGGFGVVRSGTYRGGRVAVKTAKLKHAKVEKIRKVKIDAIFIYA